MKTWPLAVAGSMMLHATVMTSVYLLPAGGAAAMAPGADLASGLMGDTAPLYLIPDSLPADVAARLAAEPVPAPAEVVIEQPPMPPPAVAVQPPPKPLEPIPVPLGVIDGPKIDTTSWMKSTATGENGGIESLVDQPQMDIKARPAPQGDPGQGGNDGKNGAKAAPAVARPVVAAPMDGPIGPPAPAMVEVRPEPAIAGSQGEERQRRDEPEGPSHKEIKAGNAGGETPRLVQAASEPAAHPAPSVAKPAVEGLKGSTPGSSADAPAPEADNPGASGASGTPMADKTVAADRDADAASVKRAAVFRNGKVEAGEGLDIRTVRPEFSLATRALRQPRSPTLEIVFGRDGRARSVRVLKSSGFPYEVDEPVKTALYNWRAKGRLLDDLPLRPDAVVLLEITVILQ
ncbi:MAG: hypothetical protein Q8L55_01570 [Phycisphaerales bacterium]|nr:hypothetical protein [Phycisphaerales bacterium]